MTRSFLKILLVASALVPVAAQAQRFGAEAPGNGEMRGDWSDRGDRGDRGDRPQRADQGTVVQGQARGDGGYGRNGRPDAPRQDWNARVGSDRQADQVRENWVRGNAQRDAARQDVRNDRRGQPDRARFDGRPGEDRGYRDVPRGRDDLRGRPDGRGRDDWRGRDGDRDRGGYRSGQHFGGYGTVQGYGRGGYGQRGAWNRGWRSDNRYGWSDYRASNRGAYRLPRYYAPNGWGSGYRRFGIGFSLNSILYNQNYWIQDPYTYRLPEAYGPYRWVRYYNDALLVDLDSGRVVDTVYDIFW
ncbi:MULTISPECIES: RcnB family protein [unclassified Sphingomonas]|jgi:hypothetical protein|uniref:RcnB family protein n=1 Tax=unclassified Sphingomonas TaxID=196159 RepID=UPI0004DF1ADF|nr:MULTISPECIES: RcnB family protein [unclassified Sphingomonas]MBD8470623.1 RcnB family protein [Sphingomonas sp. CFBP 8765]